MWDCDACGGGCQQALVRTISDCSFFTEQSEGVTAKGCLYLWVYFVVHVCVFLTLEITAKGPGCIPFGVVGASVETGSPVDSSSLYLIFFYNKNIPSCSEWRIALLGALFSSQVVQTWYSALQIVSLLPNRCMSFEVKGATVILAPLRYSLWKKYIDAYCSQGGSCWLPVSH